MLCLSILTLASLLGPAVSHLGSYTSPELLFRDSNFPHPRILLLGGTGTGKSTLGNVLLGRRHNDKPQKFSASRCFHTGKRNDLVTLETCADSGHWMGTGPRVTIIDTPGYGDTTPQRDLNTTENLFNFMKNEIRYVDAIVLLFNGRAPRMTWSMVNMLKQAENMFGHRVWDNIIIEATFWSYGHSYKRLRNLNDETEESFTDARNERLKENFESLNKDLDTVFIHPLYNPEDAHEKTQFEKNTAKLFEFAEKAKPLPFKPISVLLDETAMYKREQEQMMREQRRMQNEIVSLEERIEALNNQRDVVPDCPCVEVGNATDCSISMHQIQCIGRAISNNLGINII